MKKLLIILAFIPLVCLGQYQTTNLDFLFNGSITVNGSDTLLVDSITGTFDTDYILSFVDFNVNLGYLPGKSKAKLNGIPIATYFTNFNYADTLFAQWLDHTIDSDSTEILPFRIQRIAHYSTPTTDINDYFETPSKISGAVWVASDGDDGTGDGSEGNPYLTITKGISSAGVLGTTYVKSNAYNEYIYNLYANSIKSVGFADYTSTNATYSNRLRFNSGVTYERMTVNDGLEVTASIYGQNADSLEIISVYINTGSANAVLGDYAVIRNSVFTGSNSSFAINNTTGTQPRLIKENLFSNASQAVVYNPNNMGELTLLNNDVDSAAMGRFLWNLNTSDKVNVIGNNIELEGASYYIFSDGDLGGIDVKSNIFDVNLTTSEVLYFRSHVTNPPYVYNNTFNIENNVDEIIVYGENSAIEASKNTFNLDAEITSNAEILSLINADNTYSYFKANNNSISSKRTGGYSIGVGSEGTTLGDNDISSIEIIGNYIKGRHAYPAPTTNTTHGIFVGFQINADIKYNFTDGAGYADVLKGTIGTTYTSNGITYNVNKEFLRGIYCKGVSAVQISNNTFFSEDVTPDYAILLADNIGGDSSINCIVKNNIFVYLGTGTYNPIELLNNSTEHNIDYNLYYCPNGTLQFINENGVRTFAQWQADGFDANSHVLTNSEFNNLFNDYENDDFSINRMPFFGENLGLEYNTGLEKTTSWPSDIVLTKQLSRWSIGAYIADKQINSAVRYINGFCIYNNKIVGY